MKEAQSKEVAISIALSVTAGIATIFYCVAISSVLYSFMVPNGRLFGLISGIPVAMAILSFNRSVLYRRVDWSQKTQDMFFAIYTLIITIIFISLLILPKDIAIFFAEEFLREYIRTSIIYASFSGLIACMTYFFAIRPYTDKT